MNRPDESRDTHIATGAYVLHALTPDERAAVDAVASRSEELRGELAELSDTAVMLALAMPEIAPPPSLRSRLLDAIETVPQLAAEPADAVEAAEVSPLATATHLVPRRRVRRRPAILVAVAAVIALVFGGGLLVDRVVMAPQTQYAAITSAADVQTSVADVAGGGTATVYWSASHHGTAVVLHDVATPSGKSLQLWSVHGSTATSEGLYGGNFRLIDGTPTSGEKLAVSIEPAGGSKRPTQVITDVALT